MPDLRFTPCLWFDDKAEEAAEYYVSLFPNSEITRIQRYWQGSHMPEGTALLVNFTLDGAPCSALNGGQDHPFTMALSLMARCDDQAEIDRLWSRLLEDGGEEMQCGWIKDRYGLHWQVLPRELETLMSEDAAAQARVMASIETMVKLDIETMRAARDAA